jgi:aspartate dehydrogenase
MADPSARTRVGLIGHGAIGSVVARELVAGAVAGVELTAVLDPLSRHPELGVDSLEEMLPVVDLVVEAAGHGALSDYGPTIVESGKRLLIVSVGALADPDLHAEVLAAGADRIMYTTGAIGAVDALRAAVLAGGLDHVSMTSTKPASNLLRDWMDTALRSAIQTGEEAVVAFDGSARDACRLFPESANVFATLALATLGFDDVGATLIADPGATRVEHVIRAEGAVGSYRFTFNNLPSADNPKTSAIVPWAVLRAIGDLHPSAAVFI